MATARMSKTLLGCLRLVRRITIFDMVVAFQMYVLRPEICLGMTENLTPQLIAMQQKTFAKCLWSLVTQQTRHCRAAVGPSARDASLVNAQREFLDMINPFRLQAVAASTLHGAAACLRQPNAQIDKSNLPRAPRQETVQCM